MAMASTLAYYDAATITAVKSFIVEAPSLIFVIKTGDFSLSDFTRVGSSIAHKYGRSVLQ